MAFRTVFFLLLFVKSSLLLSNDLRIGGLFDTDNSLEEAVFRYAVDHINNNSRLLPRSRILPHIDRIPHHNSFYAAKRACDSLMLGVAALFGPKASSTAAHIQSICEAKEIPHIETRGRINKIGDYSVNLHPHPCTLSKAYMSLVEALGWKDFVILYEDNEGLLRLQDLNKFPSVSFRQIKPGPGMDYRPLMNDLKKTGVTKILLDCATENIQDIFKQAEQVGMMTAYNNYIVTNLDLSMVDLEDFKYGGTNITSMQLVDPYNKKVANVIKELASGGKYFKRLNKFDGKSIPTETALLYDAVLLLAQALNNLHRAQDIQTAALTCDGDDTWEHGKSLINYIKAAEMEGLTGKIKFDDSRLRSDFTLDIVELKEEGLVHAGRWDSRTGANFSRNSSQRLYHIKEGLHNKILKIVTILSEPYTMIKRDSNDLKGIARYEGFNIDLVKLLSKVLKFKYTIELVKDMKYGSKNNSTGKWNGIMGEIQQREADLGVADLTMTYDRQQDVDFSMPYMDLGITILYRTPTKARPNQFAFLAPLTFSVWLYIIGAYCFVSILMYLLAKFSPYEKSSLSHCNNRCHNNDDDAEQDETVSSSGVKTVTLLAGDASKAEMVDASPQTTFTLANSFWFILASMFRQKVEITPSAHSTRLITALWWFFTLMMVSSYTANLAAFLTTERMETPLESVHDLAMQKKIKFGVVKGGSTAEFFKNSEIDMYARMWNQMEQNPYVFVGSSQEGVDKVKSGEYAFMGESTMVEYITGRDCELMQLGGLLNSKGYGIALPKNSPYRSSINSALLKLQDEGVLSKLKQKWWYVERGGGQCVGEYMYYDSNCVSSLGQDNVGGIFVFLLVGLVFSGIIAIVEFCYQCFTARKREKLRAQQLTL